MATSRRTYFVLASILIHTGLGVGVFAAGVWNIERLDGGIRSNNSFAVILPPMPAPSGGEIKLAEVKLDRKQKKTVKEPVQPTVIQDTSTTPVVPTTGSNGDGSGSGPGSGSGSAGETGECQRDCGPGPTAPAQDPEPRREEATFVPPNVLTMMRLTGSTQIHPSEITKTQMLRDGRPKTVGVAKVCVSEIGAVTHVSMLTSTKYPAYDALLIGGIRSWRYKPYAAKGRNLKVCGTVTFVYGITGARM